MELTFWGVRGSYPVPGPHTIRYGGQTSCVEVRNNKGTCLIIDAGTGLRALGQKLARERGDAPEWSYHFILSHVHWDHIQGLPFFEPAYVEGTQISIYAGAAAADELKGVIGGITRHEFFPMPLDAVPAEFTFHEVAPLMPFQIDGFEIVGVPLNHPFGAVGYRIDADGTSVAYVSDTAPFNDVLHKQHFLHGPEALTADDKKQLGRLRADLIKVLKDCHSVIYDTHFTTEEYARFPHYGHSTPDHALELCQEAGVKRLILYHHAPAHSDAQMDDIGRSYKVRGSAVGIDVVVAKERMSMAVGGRKGGKRATTDPGVGP
jgi:phosphoribosyl 1,2-cyclic phosphodiesterase